MESREHDVGTCSLHKVSHAREVLARAEATLEQEEGREAPAHTTGQSRRETSAIKEASTQTRRVWRGRCH